MTNAEQWLADMEAKAKAATWRDALVDYHPVISLKLNHAAKSIDECILRLKEMDFTWMCLDLGTDDDMGSGIQEIFVPAHSAANPAAMLRLVHMVRWLADNIPGVVRPCAGYSRKCFLGDITKCEGDSDAECWIAAAYIATETAC